LLAGDQPLVIALDQVQDPQNLGAVCRSAEGAGATGVVIPERRAAEITPAVCRASAGAVEHLRVARVRNLADFLGEAKRAGAWVYGAAAEAERLYTDVDWGGAAVIVLGSEGKGLRPRVREACDDLVRVPLHGQVGSLNVGATAAVLLYEAVRSRAAAP
jgi:23S rRNA (guanosine2251-2'-O)-methyltransferase